MDPSRKSDLLFPTINQVIAPAPTITATPPQTGSTFVPAMTSVLDLLQTSPGKDVGNTLFVAPGSAQQAATIRVRLTQTPDDIDEYIEIISNWPIGCPEVHQEARCSREAFREAFKDDQNPTVEICIQDLDDHPMVMAYKTAISRFVPNSLEVFQEAEALIRLFKDPTLRWKAFMACESLADVLDPTRPQASILIEKMLDELFSALQSARNDNYFYVASQVYIKLFQNCAVPRQCLELLRNRFIMRNRPSVAWDKLADHYIDLINTKPRLQDEVYVEEAKEILSLCRHANDPTLDKIAHMALNNLVYFLPTESDILPKIRDHYQKRFRDAFSNNLYADDMMGYAVVVFKMPYNENERNGARGMLRSQKAPDIARQIYTYRDTRRRDLTRLYRHLIPLFSKDEVAKEATVLRESAGHRERSLDWARLYTALISEFSEDLFFEELKRLPGLLRGYWEHSRDELTEALRERFFELRRRKIIPEDQVFLINRCYKLIEKSRRYREVRSGIVILMRDFLEGKKGGIFSVPYGEGGSIQFQEDHGFLIISPESAALIYERLTIIESGFSTADIAYRGPIDLKLQGNALDEISFLLGVLDTQTSEAQKQFGFPSLSYNEKPPKQSFVVKWGLSFLELVGLYKPHQE